MPQISQITPQKRRGFFNIYIDGEFAFGLEAETLIREKLSAGQNLSDGDLERLKGVSLYSKLLNQSLNFLSFRPRSKKEIEQNLDQKIYKILDNKNKGFAAKAKGQVVSKLESLGLINDQDFARWWVEQRTRSPKSSRGPLLVRRELFSRGIGRETVDEALKKTEGAAPSTLVLPLLAKKDKNLKSDSPLRRRQKLLAHLLRRGFDFEAAKTAVAEYLKRE